MIRELLCENTIINVPEPDLALPSDEEGFVRQVRQALENHEFTVFYQPQYSYNTKKICGAEALMRWKHGEQILSPERFIPRLERSGMIYEVDRFIWRRACQALSEWKQAGLEVPYLSVNISGLDIHYADLEEYLSALLGEYALLPQDLHLEITETAYMKDLDRMIRVIESLQRKGFVVEMDDFGSGYSSLAALKNIPFDVIKLDMEFLQESEINEKARQILSSVIEMLQKIRLPVIVEGVEYEAQAELLNRLGCDYMQGYYFGKPTDRDEFEKLLTEAKKG